MRNIAVGIFALITAACGSANIQHQELKLVQTAAIVGFSAELNLVDQAQRGGVTGSIGTIQEMKKLGSPEQIAKRQEQAHGLYDTLSTKLSEKMNWTLQARETVVANPGNAEVYAQRTPNPNSRLATGGSRIYAPNILRQDMVRSLKPEERLKLFESLGVDALVFTHLNFVVGGKGKGAVVGGMGSQEVYPAAVLNFAVFKKGMEAAVWKMGFVRGEPSTTGVRTTMGVQNDSKMTEALMEAAAHGYEMLFEKLEQDRIKQEQKAVATAAKAES